MSKRWLAVGVVAVAVAAALRWGVGLGAQKAFAAPAVEESKLLAEVPEDLRLPDPSREARAAWDELIAATNASPRLTFEDTAVLEQTLRHPEHLMRADVRKKLEACFQKHAGPMAEVEGLIGKDAKSGDFVGGENPVNALRGLQTHVTLFARRGSLRLANGQPEKGVGDLITSHRLAEKLCGSGGPVYYVMLSNSLLNRAQREIQSAAARPYITADMLKSLAKALPSTSQLAQDFKSSLRSELHWFIVHEVQRLSGPGGNSSLPAMDKASMRDNDSGWREADQIAVTVLAGHKKPFDRLETVRAVAPVYRQLIENIDLPWNRQHNVAAAIGRLVADWPTVALTGAEVGSEEVTKAIEKSQDAILRATNPYGRFAAWYFLPISDQSQLVPFKMRADLEATRSILALSAFERENRRPAQGWSELVRGGYLAKVPTDPFDGKPLRYDPTARRIWSVGPNAIDEKGERALGSLTRKDIVWDLPLVKN